MATGVNLIIPTGYTALDRVIRNLPVRIAKPGEFKSIEFGVGEYLRELI